ncbi:MAG: HPF/RaiA family ribosome-associated protein [Bacteroidaceae bacterium]|jgi:integrase/recombinase XerC|nr:HPF/RaiA family ribosome-associated protein [Bacteroidaceae bacterium]
METRIQSVHFDASQQLMEFVEKKVAKLEKHCEGATALEVTMKLIKPETVRNKEVALRVAAAGGDLFASKTGDTFEDALLDAIDAIKVQAEKKQK